MKTWARVMQPTIVFLALVLAMVVLWGPLVHGMLPHQHSKNDAVANLLHSALRHEDKTLGDIVPATPIFTAVVVALIFSTLLLPFIPAVMLRARAPSLAPLRRGILPYRRFG